MGAAVEAISRGAPRGEQFKRAVVTGLLADVASGLLYPSVVGFVASPTIVLLGRALLRTESLLITRAVSWG
jgi:hypothetical protein